MRFYLFIDKLMKIFFSLFNGLSELIFHVNFIAKKELKKNKDVQRKNERCFIICNGPSLKNIDIKSITNADTMTVNFFYKNDVFENFYADYHVAIDGGFYTEENMPYLKKILETYPDIKLFVKRNALKYFEKDKERVFGLYAKRIQNGNPRIDINKNMTAAINVSIMAVQIALSLGYKEIYLLGVDFSEYVNKPGEENHFYKGQTYKGNLKKGDELRWFSIAYKHHYALQKLALKKGVKIWNASDGSLLDAYPHIEFKKI